MSIKSLVRSALVASLMLVPAIAFGGSAGSTVSITATVDQFAEWSNATPAIVAADWSAHITDTTTARTATLNLQLFTNADTTITPTGGANSGVLTNGSQVLTTSYKLTGAGLDTPDVAFKATGAGAGQFFEVTNTYAITHVSGTGSYAVNLVVQAVAPSSTSAPDAGDYTAGVVLTASW